MKHVVMHKASSFFITSVILMLIAIVYDFLRRESPLIHVPFGHRRLALRWSYGTTVGMKRRLIFYGSMP